MKNLKKSKKKKILNNRIKRQRHLAHQKPTQKLPKKKIQKIPNQQIKKLHQKVLQKVPENNRPKLLQRIKRN
jgi:hypothetical protein